MSPPTVVVLDTRNAHDKSAFLSAAAQCLDFPSYFGHNWDAFADCLGDFTRERSPVLVVWTGASVLTSTDRHVALEIMTERFVDGADLLIVDDVTSEPQPDFALDHVRVAIPTGAEELARVYWIRLVGLTQVTDPWPDDGGLWLAGDALSLHVHPQDHFQPAQQSHPAIMVRDYDALQRRLQEHGYRVRPLAGDRRRFCTDDPFGNHIEFIEF